MRQGEKSKIMVKPRYGYAMPEYAGSVEFPEGWTKDEKKTELQRRRSFFEVKLIDWIVRHDLLGEGSMLKTIHTRGTGYDRPALYDEVVIDLKVFQKDEAGEEKVFASVQEHELLMTDQDLLTPVVRKILQSMKYGEKTSTVVTPQYVQQTDPGFKERHADYNPDDELLVDISLLSLGKIEDMYRDQKVFYKTLVKGQGAASPYFDCKVTLRVKIEVDGETKEDMFKIGQIEEFGTEVVAGDCLVFDLEEYQVPGVVRKMLKITKPYEIVQIKCQRKDKLTDHLPDVQGIFRHEYFENFEDKVIITL